MSNTIGFGQAAVNNTIDYGQGATDNTINWGKSQTLSPSGETNITGGGGTPPFSNTKSILLDGVDDFVTMGNVLDFERTDAFSVSLWFKRTRTGVSEFLFSKSESSGNYRGYSVFFPADNRVLLYIGSTTSNRILLYSGNTITDTNWHSLVVTYSGSSASSGMAIYIDGVDDTGAPSGTLSTTISNSSSFEIGSRNGNVFSGSIDELAVFNSELSASDVTTIYNGGVPNDISSLSPLSWWRCGDGDTAPTLTDNGSGGNDGTMTNFSAFSTDVPTASSFTNTKSILLDGIDDYVDCGQVTQIQNTNALSVSCWFNYKTIASSVNGIVSKDSTSRSDGNWYISTQNATIRFLVKTANGQDALNSGTISLNSWNNLLCVWNGSTMKIYINGTLNNSISLSNATGTLGLRTSDVLIGRRLVGSIADGFFNGGVDEVAVWNTDQSANASAIGSTIPTDLSIYSPLSWWRCGDSDTAPTLTDNGSGGNDGTMTNFTTFSTDVPT